MNCCSSDDQLRHGLAQRNCSTFMNLQYLYRINNQKYIDIYFVFLFNF